MAEVTEEFFDAELADLREQWEAGSFAALINAFRTCAVGKRPLPDWLALAVDDELCWAYSARPSGAGRTGNRAARDNQDSVHKMRAAAVDLCLKMQRVVRGAECAESLAEAGREASEMLRGSVAQASGPAMVDSYKLLKSGEEKGGELNP